MPHIKILSEGFPFVSIIVIHIFKSGWTNIAIDPLEDSNQEGTTIDVHWKKEESTEGLSGQLQEVQAWRLLNGQGALCH